MDADAAGSLVQGSGYAPRVGRRAQDRVRLWKPEGRFGFAKGLIDSALLDVGLLDGVDRGMWNVTLSRDKRAAVLRCTLGIPRTSTLEVQQ